MHSISATYYDDANEDITEQSTTASAVCLSCLHFTEFFKRRQKNGNFEKNPAQSLNSLWCFQRSKNNDKNSRRSQAIGKDIIGLIDNDNNWVYMDPKTAEKYKQKNERLSVLLKEQLADPKFFQYDYDTVVRKNHEKQRMFTRYGSSVERKEPYESVDEYGMGEKLFMKLLLYTEEERRSDISKNNAGVGTSKELNIHRTTLDPLNLYFTQNRDRHDYSKKRYHFNEGPNRNLNREKLAAVQCKKNEKKDVESESFIVSPKRRRRYIDVSGGSEDVNKYINTSISQSHSTENTAPETNEMQSSFDLSFSDISTFLEFMGYLESVEFDNVSTDWWRDNSTLSSVHEKNLILKSIKTPSILKEEKKATENLFQKCTKRLANKILLILPIKSKTIDKKKIRVIVNSVETEEGSDSDPYHLLKRSKVELEPIDLKDITMVED